MEVLIVTWQAGGGAQVAIGLGRLLAERGDRVRIVAPRVDAARVAAAGCVHRPFPAELELDPTRRAEEQREVLGRIFFGRGLVDMVSAELAAAPCDVIVVDYLLRTMAGAAERLPAANALLIHTIFGFHGGRYEEPAARRRWFEPVNAARRELGLDELPTDPDSVTVALARRAAGAVVAVPREFDDWPDPPPNVVYAGPIVERAGAVDWTPPWDPGDARPLVVVSLGTQYMQQEAVLGRVVEALEGLAVRGLVLTGHELSPETIAPAPNVEVRGYVPHAAALASASLVVTHGGTGTLLAAFAAGLPVVCVPLGRDQPQNARRVEELGLGRAVSMDAPVAEVRAAIAELLDSVDHRQRVARMASAINGYEGGAPAVEALRAVRF